jgi:two-component system, NtrC family, nitrogen regulation sensor histidine kinase NtrY
MITLQQLSKTFRTEEVETKALHEVTLTINQGDFISIMGPSGSGKSTLLNSVFATQDHEQKNIYINGTIKEKRILITISDTGKGIEPEIQDKIFLPFFTTRKDGAGIGLTLSKSIVEAHGGYLIHQNDLENTTFTVCLI